MVLIVVEATSITTLRVCRYNNGRDAIESRVLFLQRCSRNTASLQLLELIVAGIANVADRLAILILRHHPVYLSKHHVLMLCIPFSCFCFPITALISPNSFPTPSQFPRFALPSTTSTTTQQCHCGVRLAEERAVAKRLYRSPDHHALLSRGRKPVPRNPPARTQTSSTDLDSVVRHFTISSPAPL